MTKTKLKEVMEEFIARQNDTNKDDWYCTDRMVAQYVLESFAADLGITLEDEDVVQV